jgi:sugar phosphate isomerase/epimerase
MRYGCCVSLERLPRLADFGFDFAEMAVRHLLPEQPEAEFAPIRGELLASPVKVEAWNVFLPADLKITGPQVNHARVARYVYTALVRIAKVGGKLVVLGSGGARRAPDGFSVERARDQLLHFLELAAEIALERDLTIAIEPLNREEDNLVTTVAQAVELARLAAHPRVRVLADIYHSLKEQEPFEEITRAGPLLAHLHLSDAARRPPRAPDEEIASFLAAAARAGYDGRVSVEAAWQDFEAEAPRALEVLRESAP